jgi:nicotinate-nucleotide--dimethylbenzimidazole phosphoribosyltransferase
MTRAQVLSAIKVGMNLLEAEAARGLDLVATGEMGFGKTTAASALVAALAGASVAAVTGRGTGVDDEGLARKVAAVERALAVNRPDPADPLGVLAALGGLEIAALVGLILAAAARRIPVLLDGFIAGAAALVAAALCPLVREHLIASHRSAEPGHTLILAHLGLEPLLALDLRLGEGTGAALAMPLVDAALAVLDEMATLTEAGVTPDRPGMPRAVC